MLKSVNAYWSFISTVIGLSLVMSGCASAPATDAATDSDTGPIGSDSSDAASDVSNPTNALAHCFEIFPATPTWPDGGAVSGEAGGVPHSNPLAYEFGVVPVGQTATASIRYYNFCGDVSAAIVGTSSEPPSEASSFTVMSPAVGPVMQDVTWSVSFHPASAGEHRLTVRVQTNSGVYESDLHGTGQ